MLLIFKQISFYYIELTLNKNIYSYFITTFAPSFNNRQKKHE